MIRKFTISFNFFPQMVDNLSHLWFCVWFVFLLTPGFRLYLFQKTAEIHKDSTTIHRITSHVLGSVTIKQNRMFSAFHSYTRGYHRSCFNLLLCNLTLCYYLLLAIDHCQRVLLNQLGFCCTSTTSLQ